MTTVQLSDVKRREFLRLAMGAGAGAVFSGVAEGATRSETFTYKKAGQLAIKLDVLRADDRAERPVAVWIHGGALINGHRAAVPRRVKDMMLGAGYILVSIDYRLAPESPLTAIVEDLEEAFRWIHENGAARLQARAGKVAVMGGSAGGYLTLTAGYRARPRPAVLVSFWGYGDLIGDWLSKPSPHERHHRVAMSREEAYRQVSGNPVSDSRDRAGNGGAFYQYCRRQGIWPKAVSGWDPAAEGGKFVPYMPVRNVTADYPPTLLIHGDADTDVPHEQSVMMARQLKQHGVEHELITIAGGEHGLAGGDPARVDQAYDSALHFIERHMRENPSR